MNWWWKYFEALWLIAQGVEVSSWSLYCRAVDLCLTGGVELLIWCWWSLKTRSAYILSLCSSPASIGSAGCINSSFAWKVSKSITSISEGCKWAQHKLTVYVIIAAINTHILQHWYLWLPLYFGYNPLLSFCSLFSCSGYLTDLIKSTFRQSQIHWT